jgi:hypothetical protein
MSQQNNKCHNKTTNVTKKQQMSQQNNKCHNNNKSHNTKSNSVKAVSWNTDNLWAVKLLLQHREII